MQVSKRINQTGRKRIHRQDVTINLLEHKDRKPTFTASFRLDQSIVRSGVIYVEAYSGSGSNTLQRFCYGAVEAPVAPASTSLDQIDLSAPVKFRVKVVDESGFSGKLVASAEGLRSEEDSDEENRASLMTFKSADMGSLPWKVVCDDDDSKPVLYVNNQIRGAKDHLINNPVFRSLILPGALREVLLSILYNLDGDEAEDNSWQESWLNFAREISPLTFGLASKDLTHEWVNEVSSAFSEKFSLCESMVKLMEAE